MRRNEADNNQNPQGRNLLDTRMSRADFLAFTATAFGFGGLLALRPRVAEAQAGCPTQGPLVAPCPVPEGTDLRAASRFSRYYFIDSDNSGRYSPADRDVMGVPDAQLVVESLESIGLSDTIDIVLSSRQIELINGVERVSYWDQKHNMRRYVQRWDVMRVPHDGGVGLALAANGTDTLDWRLQPGQLADKVYGPIASEERVNRNGCGGAVPCGFNCVEWVVVHRLKAGASVNGLRNVPNELIHRDLTNGAISGIVDYVYFWDLNQGEQVRVDHSYINTPVQEGDALWQREGLSYKSVARPPRIVPYNNTQ